MADTNLSAFLWSVADLLRGDYKQSDYGKVILPFTVLRRLDCVLESTKDAVLKEHAARTKAKVNPEPFLLRKAGERKLRADAADQGRRSRAREASIRRERDEPAFTVGGEGEAGQQVVESRVGEVTENRLHGPTRREVPEDVVPGDPRSADARLPPALRRVDRDESAIVHDAPT